MSFEDFENDEIVLIKPDASEHKARASVQGGVIFVFDTTFPVEAGDEIRHVLPSRVVQHFRVIDPGYISGFGSGHYEIKVRNAATPSESTPVSSVVNNHHHYNNSGIANVMGPDGVASGNKNSIQITHQTLSLEDPRISAELAELRTALAAEPDDDDAAIEIGKVASAQKALKAGNQSGFVTAIKQLGTKAWAVAQQLGLAWLTKEARHRLGLPDR